MHFKMKVYYKKFLTHVIFLLKSQLMVKSSLSELLSAMCFNVIYYFDHFFTAQFDLIISKSRVFEKSVWADGKQLPIGPPTQSRLGPST